MKIRLNLNKIKLHKDLLFYFQQGAVTDHEGREDITLTLILLMGNSTPFVLVFSPLKYVMNNLLPKK